MAFAAIQEELDHLDDRADTLEIILGQFMVSTNKALLRLEKSFESLHGEMKEFKDEMKAYRERSEKSDNQFRDEMKTYRERSEKSDNQFRDEMKAYRERSEKSDNQFRDEMKEFKDEMKAYRERSEKSDNQFRDEMKTYRERSEKSDNQFRDEMKTYRERSEKSDNQFRDEMKEFKDEMKEFKIDSEKDRKEMNKKWGELANKMGTVVEDIVAPNIPGIARNYFKVETLEYFAIRVRKLNKDKSRQKEFDIVATSDKYFFLNETKASPRPEYAKEFKESLARVPDFFPEYADKKLIPIFSSLNMHPDIVTYLSRNGIYAMVMKDDTMDLLNFDEVFGASLS